MQISIVMPVYNSEKQLEKSIESVLQQTDGNWELIIVNDGSTDGTAEICEGLARKDQRIKVYHIQNHGPADARNVGVYYAGGLYTIFLDSDDRLAPRSIETLRKAVETEDYEIVFYGYTHDTYAGEEKKSSVKTVMRADTFRRNGEFKKVYEELDQKGMTHPVWNKMFLTEFLKDNVILFPSGIFISEDFIFNLTAYTLAQRILIIEDVLYQYISRESGSITTSFRKNKIKEMESVYDKSYRLMENWQPKHLNKINNEFLGNISVYVNSLYKPDCPLSEEEKREVLAEIFQSRYVRQCLKDIQPVGYRNKIMKYLLKNKKINLLMLVGRLANSYVRKLI